MQKFDYQNHQPPCSFAPDLHQSHHAKFFFQLPCPYMHAFFAGNKQQTTKVFSKEIQTTHTQSKYTDRRLVDGSIIWFMQSQIMGIKWPSTRVWLQSDLRNKKKQENNQKNGKQKPTRIKLWLGDKWIRNTLFLQIYKSSGHVWSCWPSHKLLIMPKGVNYQRQGVWFLLMNRIMEQFTTKSIGMTEFSFDFFRFPIFKNWEKKLGLVE